MEKAKARQEAKRCIAALTPASRMQCNRLIAERLRELDEFQRAHVVMAFCTLPDEVDTKPVIQEALTRGKRVALPVCRRGSEEMTAVELTETNTQLVKSPFSFLQPANGTEIPPDGFDLILVPGLAFDRSGVRLGRGGGYYDRFLARKCEDTVTCAVVYACQVFDVVPNHHWDVSVDIIVTETETIRTAP